MGVFDPFSLRCLKASAELGLMSEVVDRLYIFSHEKLWSIDYRFLSLLVLLCRLPSRYLWTALFPSAPNDNGTWDPLLCDLRPLAGITKTLAMFDVD